MERVQFGRKLSIRKNCEMVPRICNMASEFINGKTITTNSNRKIFNAWEIKPRKKSHAKWHE